MKTQTILKKKILSAFMVVMMTFSALLPIMLAPVTVSAADPISLNTINYSGNFQPNSATKQYSFDAPSPGSITVSYALTSSGTIGEVWQMRVYSINQSNNQEQLLYTKLFGTLINGTTEYTTPITLPTAGRYYLEISDTASYSYIFSSYSFSVNFTAGNAGNAANTTGNTPSTAWSLDFTSAGKAERSGKTTLQTDVNYYRLSLTAPGSLTLSFSIASSMTDGNWKLELFDESSLSSSSYSGTNAKALQTENVGFNGSIVSGTKLNTLNKLRLPAGIYYIRISPYNTSGSTLSTDYRIMASFTAEVTGADAINNFEKEFNDVSAIATKISLDRAITGNLSDISDIDYYEFEIFGREAVRLQLETPGSINQNHWTVYLLSDKNTEVYMTRWGQGGTVSSTKRIFVSDALTLETGKYYVAVHSTSNNAFPAEANQDYILTVTSSTTPVSPEMGNAVALRTGVNNYTTDKLVDFSDIKYYKVAIEENGRFTVNFAMPNTITAKSWTVTIFSSDARTILYEDEFGADGTQDSTSSVYKTKNSNKLRLAKGTYFISVQAYNRLNYTNADYRLGVDFVAESVNNHEQEFNNTAETANLINFNKDITANISNVINTVDMDYYRIVAENTNTIQIRFSVNKDVDTRRFWNVKVYDAQQKEMKSYKIGGEGLVSDNLRYFKTEVISVSPGAYYISVAPYSSDDFSNEDYIIKVMDSEGQKIDSALSVPYSYTLDTPSSWARSEVERAYAYGLVPQSYMNSFTNYITREEFCVLTMEFLKTYEKKSIETMLSEKGKYIDPNTFTDTNNPTILAAYELGIIKGKGNAIFDPVGEITREQAAIMLGRLANLVGITPNTTGVDFPDSDKFIHGVEGLTAARYISSCIDNRDTRVMQGHANGNFDPVGYYTREQSYLTMIRLFFVK